MIARGITAPNDELMRIVLRLYDQDAAAVAPIRSALLRNPVSLMIIVAALWLALGSIQLVKIEPAPSRPAADFALPRSEPAISQSAAPIIATPERQRLRTIEPRRASAPHGRRKATPVTRVPDSPGNVQAMSGVSSPFEIKPLDRPVSPDRPTPAILEKRTQPAAPGALDGGPIRESKNVASKHEPDPAPPIAPADKARRDANDAILAIRLQ